MQLRQASRKRASIRLALQSPSGAGKTMSALLIAFGLTDDWSKIAVIDTEHRSADLYAHLGSYNVLPLSQPYSPERYIEAVQLCTAAGMQVIIIDSATHEWDYILQQHAAMPGNSFTNWAKVNPRHEAFVQAILQSEVHIIATIRSKQDYVLTEKNGKQVPEKVGMKGMQRDNLEYEFTAVLELDMGHRAKASKDRTGLFADKPLFIPSADTGRQILHWCNSGAATITVTASAVRQQIQNCTSNEALLVLYHTYPQHQQELLPAFTKRRQQISQQKQNYAHSG